MKLKKMFRAISSDDVVIDEEARTVEFSFSSEEPVERFFGTEILSHEAGAMDFGRINAKAAPYLWNHDTNQPIGMIESGSLVGKRGRAKAKYFSTPFAQEKMQQMKEGLKNISFAYRIIEMEQVKGAESGKPPVFKATKYEVYEISLVSVPADYSIGVGRSDLDEEVEVPVTNIRGSQRNMNDTEQSRTELAVKDAETKVRAQAKAEELARITALTEIGKTFEKYGAREIADQFIANGKSVEEARAAVMERMGHKQKPVSGTESVIGLTEKEVRKYSLMRAINAMANPTDYASQENAKFEREVSQAAAQASGKAARGFMIPVDILRAGSKRDLTVGTSTAGGHLVGTELQAGSFIEVLRKRMVTQALGATVLNGLKGSIAIPRQTSGATSYWVAESGAPTEGAIAFDQVTMAPKTVGAFVDMSRKLLIQSSIDVENMAMNDLAKSLGLAIDLAALYGTGSANQPSGLNVLSGLNTKNFANDAPTFAEIVGMETEVASDNADVGSLAYLTNAAGRGTLKSTLVTATYGDRMIWERDNTVNGYRCEVSNQVASSSAAHDYWFGNWADLMIAFWSGLDVLVDPYTASTTGVVRVVVFQDCDVAARHPESFCKGANNP